MRARSRLLWTAVFLIPVVSMGIFALARRTSLSDSGGGIPVVAVKRGDVDLKVYGTGEVRSSHSMMLSAPTIGGGILQITHLLRTGTAVKKNDVVIEFDPSEQQYNVEQNRSELLEADEEITKVKADAAVEAAQDKVALLKAQFDVRRAELEVGKNELVSTIEGKKNELALDQARRALAQLEQDIRSHTASGQASIALAEERRHKAQLAMSQAEQNTEKMRVRSPMDGVVAIEKNVDSTGGGMFWGGMSLPEYREGDQTHPGNTIARVIDPHQMEVTAKITESDGSNVKLGEAAEIRLDALPGSVFQGTVKTIAGMAIKNFWEDETGGRFDITIELSRPDPRLRAGFTAQVLILGGVRKNVLYVPRQALFLKDGKRVAYVRNGSAFEPQAIKIECETESRAAISGLEAGAEIALLDPTSAKRSPNLGAAEPILGGGSH